MVEIIFSHNLSEIGIECEGDDYIKDIINQFVIKTGRDKNSLCFNYQGEEVDQNLMIKEMIDPKNTNKIYIQVSDKKIQIKSLKKSQTDQLDKIDFDKDILQKINKDFSNDLNKINYEDSIFKEYNYILTQEVKEKLSQLYIYMKNQIPCILEGETGTSKTFSTIVLSKYLSKNWEKENFHEKFKCSDLI